MLQRRIVMLGTYFPFDSTPANLFLLFLLLALHIRPVSLACELFTVLQHGRKANLSIARFSQEKGAKSSFEKVLGGLEEVLVGRGCLVRERERCEGMRKVLGG